MGSRARETYTFAKFADAPAQYIAYEYSYSGGDWHVERHIGDRVYEFSGCGWGDEEEEDGLDLTGELPPLTEEDLKSYFAENPSPTMQFALQETQLVGRAVNVFWIVTACYECWYTSEVTIKIIGKDACNLTQIKDLSIPAEEFGETNVAFANLVIEKGLDGFIDYLQSHRAKQA